MTWRLLRGKCKLCSTLLRRTPVQWDKRLQIFQVTYFVETACCSMRRKAYEMIQVLITDDWGRCKLSEERPHICPESKACCSFTEYCVHGHCESCFGEIKDITSWCRENQSINQFPDYECRYACNEFLKSKNNVTQSTTPAVNTTQDAKYQQLMDKEEKNADTRNNDIFSVFQIIQASALFFFLTYYFIKEFLKCKKAKGNQQTVEGQSHQPTGDNNTGSSDNTENTVLSREIQSSNICGIDNEPSSSTTAVKIEEQSRNSLKYNDSTITKIAATEEMVRNVNNLLESAQTSVSEQETKQSNEPPTMNDNRPTEMDDNDDDAYDETTARDPLLEENYTAGNDDNSRDPMFNKKATSTLQMLARNTGGIDSYLTIRDLGLKESQETSDVKDEEIKHS